MASSRKSGSKGGRSRSSVSLSDVDRRYVSESLGQARSRGAASGSESEGGLMEALDRFGLGSERVEQLRSALEDMDVRESVDKAQEYLSEQIENAKEYARENPKTVIGGAAGVLVGASLLAYALRRASGESSTSRRSSSKSRSRSRKGGGSSKKSSSSSSRKSSGGSKKSSGSKKSAKRR